MKVSPVSETTAVCAVDSGLELLPLRVSSLGFDVAGRPLLADVSFTLEPGGRTCVVGPNGAGKSLLLRLCHGLIKPSHGEISWARGSADEQRRTQAMVFQRPVLLRRSVLANVEHALAARDCPHSERRPKAMAALKKAGLSELAQRNARVLSGGEQQRLALARAWALEPRVLFLDEPTAHLDPAATRAVEEVITRIDSEGVRIVMVSHDLGQVRRIASEVLFLHGGRLVEHSPVERFLDAPATPLAAAFVAGQLLW
ncbi:MAG: ABC transporter ATP-binding protein [Acidiferrobacteraceae bacterium]|nr:ABC transporter ATP-binding protein [Acidiferrobacteraceae bacterium]HJP07297.1 ATP-binding cassette domain-containing protein [Arenicellales bacterium]